jgi:uncharacterized protein
MITPEERRVLWRFKRVLKDTLRDDSVEVRLFGSKARGDDRRDSDLDLLVVVSGAAWQLADEVYAVATDLLLETGICLSPKVLGRAEYERLMREETPFIMNVAAEGVAV